MATPEEIFDILERYSSASFPTMILESMIENWPPSWGENPKILIYGDFEPPNEDIFIPELGITINRIKKEDTFIKSARCILEASVKVEDKSLESLIDAIHRINTFLGLWTLFNEHSAIGWWWYLSHATYRSISKKLEKDEKFDYIIRSIYSFPAKIRKKVDAALYWIREPQILFRDSYRSDLLRSYSGYWNAFECLVDAANEIMPEQRITKSERKRQKEKVINDIVDNIKKQNKELTLEDAIECARIVNPGFKAKASHALTVCFPSEVALKLIDQCFEIPEKSNRLYQIRNDIDHGNIDAENPKELYRVEQRFNYLNAIVRLMFLQIIKLSIQDTQKDSNSKYK